MLHILLQADGRSKHVAVLCDVADLLASRTLYIWEEWPSIAVRPG